MRPVPLPRIIKMMERIDLRLLIEMIQRAHQNLKLKRDMINSLNVFPVPDGDTGTNLLFTLKSPLNKFKESPPRTLDQALRILSRETLYGARGNSGIILAAFFEGFSESNLGKDILLAPDIIVGFERGKENAYRTMVNPVEGTMLTAIREAALAIKSEKKDVVELFKVAYKAAEKATDRSPEMLPVLKEAGAVDAGAEGFLAIIEGFLAALLKRELPIFPQRQFETTRIETEKDIKENARYCLEFHLIGDVNIENLKKDLKEMGKSIGILKRGDTTHVHIHTDTPYSVLTHVEKYGDIKGIKRELISILDNEERETKKGFRVLSLVPGEGLAKIMQELGADSIMLYSEIKPSVKDIEKALREIKNDAEKTVILPNNGDIIPVAKEAKNILGEGVMVIPTRTIPEGIAALLTMDERIDIEEIQEAIKSTKSAIVTKSIRDGKTEEGIEYKRGDYVAISEKRLCAASPNLIECVIKLLEKIGAKESSLIQFFWGKPLSPDDVKRVEEELRRSFEGPEIQFYEGGQPVYHFIVGVYL